MHLLDVFPEWVSARVPSSSGRGILSRSVYHSLLIWSSADVFMVGWDAMGSYQFNTKSRTHRFCKNCGSSILIDFEDSLKGPSDPANDTLGINVSVPSKSGVSGCFCVGKYPRLSAGRLTISPYRSDTSRISTWRKWTIRLSTGGTFYDAGEENCYMVMFTRCRRNPQ